MQSLAKLLMSAANAATWERRRQVALDRVDQGTFGLCVSCDRAIERRRIDADPLTERCAACARRASSSGAA